MKVKEVKKFFKGDHLSKPLIKYIYHPIAVYLSWIYINLKISAHIVNLLGLAASLIAAALVFYGNRMSLVFAGILILFAYVSDLCDGTVARAYNKKNAMGKWLDESAGLIGVSLVFFAFMMRTFMEKGNIIIIYLGFITIFGYMMMNFAAILSELIRAKFNLENPAEKARKKLSKKLFGINPSLLSFSFDIQWTLVALGVALDIPIVLFIVFGALSNLQWIARYAIYWKNK